MIVPPLASAIHQTYSAIANPQATGILTPQTPIPLMNSHDTATTRVRNRASEMPNPIHHQRGVPDRSTRSLTASLNDLSVTSGGDDRRLLRQIDEGHALSSSIAGLRLRIRAV